MFAQPEKGSVYEEIWETSMSDESFINPEIGMERVMGEPKQAYWALIQNVLAFTKYRCKVHFTKYTKILKKRNRVCTLTGLLMRINFLRLEFRGKRLSLRMTWIQIDPWLNESFSIWAFLGFTCCKDGKAHHLRVDRHAEEVSLYNVFAKGCCPNEGNRPARHFMGPLQVRIALR